MQLMHPNWLRYCPLHRSTLLTYAVDRWSGGGVNKTTIRRCPVCLHVARVKVHLAIAVYKQEKPWLARKERVFA